MIYAQNVLGTRWLVFFWLALEEDESRTLFWTYRMILDLFFRAVKPRMQPSRKPTSPWSFLLLFFLHGGLSNATFIFFIFYCYIQITNYYDPEGDAFQTETEVLHCIAACFYRRVKVQADLCRA